VLRSWRPATGPTQPTPSAGGSPPCPDPRPAGGACITMSHRHLLMLYNIENIFTYHAPFGDQTDRYNKIRESAKATAAVILELAPESRERSLALTNLEQAIFWANAAIARNETNPNPS